MDTNYQNPACASITIEKLYYSNRFYRQKKTVAFVILAPADYPLLCYGLYIRFKIINLLQAISEFVRRNIATTQDARETFSPSPALVC
jgi:hypothetical protein